jgi:hypothetical protein
MECEVCNSDLIENKYYCLTECVGWEKIDDEYETPDQTTGLVYVCSIPCLIIWLKNKDYLVKKIHS